MTGWAGANYAARLDLEENSLTRVKNVHIFNTMQEGETRRRQTARYKREPSEN